MAYAMSACLRSRTLKRYNRRDASLFSLSGLTGARSPAKTPFCLHFRRYAGGLGGPTPGQIDLQGQDAKEYTQTERRKTWSSWSPTLFKMLESAATTFATILVLGLAGYGYHRVRRF